MFFGVAHTRVNTVLNVSSPCYIDVDVIRATLRFSVYILSMIIEYSTVFSDLKNHMIGKITYSPVPQGWSVFDTVCRRCFLGVLELRM